MVTQQKAQCAELRAKLPGLGRLPNKQFSRFSHKVKMCKCLDTCPEMCAVKVDV